jgi:hypothetical protein
VAVTDGDTIKGGSTGTTGVAPTAAIRNAAPLFADAADVAAETLAAPA